MTRKTVAVLLILGLLAGCGNTGFLPTDRAVQTETQTAPVSDTVPIHGQAGDVEFLLDEDVFRIERSPHILLIALVLSLPILLL